jgi:hypothetical protein
MIAPIFFKTNKFDSHEGGVSMIPVSEVDFVEGLPFEAGFPIWFDLPELDFFESAGDLIEPLAV